MKRRDFSALLASAPLAGAAGSALAQGGPVEGRQFQGINPPLPTTPGKIEVVEFFGYYSRYCFAFESTVEAWAKQLPADVVFRKAHVTLRENVNGGFEIARIHQRMFYALEVLGKEAATRQAIFNAMHLQGQTLEDPRAQVMLLRAMGVDPMKYQEAYNSFAVVTRCEQADKLSEAYRIDGVPTLGIGGRFLSSPSMASGGQRMTEQELGHKLLQIADFLIQRVRSKA